MFNTLLFVHFIVSILLIIAILLQKTSSDGLSGLGSAHNNSGLVSQATISSFLVRTTTILAIIFFANAIILGNLVTKARPSIEKKIEIQENTSTIPIAQ